MTIEHVAVLALALSICTLAAFIPCLMRLYSLDVEVMAMKKSTHKIQWMPIDQDWAQNEKEVNKAFEHDQGHPDDLEGL
jgi:hypothetical protein